MAIKLKIGADPEVFLRDKSGKLVSAHSIIPGTKAVPYKVPQGALQVDGLAAEFNIDPAETAANFIMNINSVMTTLQKYAGDNQLVIEPSVIFDKDYFKGLPDVVKELGCNPDFNAWTGEVNPAPDRPEGTESLCTGSGHLHAGWTKDARPMDQMHFEDCCLFIKECDYYLGLYSLVWDPDNTRRSMYGKAGAFRPKTYGAEYRVLSNVWLLSPKLQSWIYQAIHYAIGNLTGKKKPLSVEFGDYAQRVINGNELEWYRTDEGRAVHARTGLNFPDTSEVLKREVKKPPPLVGKTIKIQMPASAITNTTTVGWTA